MGIFPDAQGQVALQSMVGSGQISNSSKTMVVLVTCKNEEDPIKNEGARVFTTLYSNFSDAQGQITLELVVVSGRNLNSFELTCMSSLPARMRMIQFKMKELECSQDFSHYKSRGDFSRCPSAANSAVLGPIWPNFELFRDVIDVLVTCKYEGDPIKNEGARVFTTFSPLYVFGSYRLPWTAEFCSDLVQNLFPYPMMLQMKFGCNRPTGLRDIQV